MLLEVHGKNYPTQTIDKKKKKGNLRKRITISQKRNKTNSINVKHYQIFTQNKQSPGRNLRRFPFDTGAPAPDSGNIFIARAIKLLFTVSVVIVILRSVSFFMTVRNVFISICHFVFVRSPLLGSVCFGTNGSFSATAAV